MRSRKFFPAQFCRTHYAPIYVDRVSPNSHTHADNLYCDRFLCSRDSRLYTINLYADVFTNDFSFTATCYQKFWTTIDKESVYSTNTDGMSLQVRIFFSFLIYDIIQIIQTFLTLKVIHNQPKIYSRSIMGL